MDSSPVHKSLGHIHNTHGHHRLEYLWQNYRKSWIFCEITESQTWREPSDPGKERSSTMPLTWASGPTGKQPVQGSSLHHNMVFLFFHENVHYVRDLNITDAFAVTLQTGLDQPRRLASEFLQWPVNDWIVSHISWPERKWKCLVLMVSLLGSLESWRYAWLDLWKSSLSFQFLWESQNTNDQTFYHLQWNYSDLDPIAIFNEKKNDSIPLSWKRVQFFLYWLLTDGPTHLYAYVYPPSICTGNQ